MTEGQTSLEAARWFAPGGLLAQQLEGFEPRDSQQRMAGAVQSAMTAGAVLAVEAETGTGKTYAYLAAALATGQRVLVSTHTKPLQDQLFGRDLPRLGAALAPVLGPPPKAAVLKGRANYLCLYRFERARGLPGPKNRFTALERIARWQRSTQAGDLDELGGLPPELSSHEISSTPDNCLGKECPKFNDCYVVKARRAAQAASLVVVNHALLLADFLLKEEGFGELLGRFDTVVVDEAHRFPELLGAALGRRFSLRQCAELMRDLAAEIKQHPELADLPGALQALQRAAAGLAAVLEGLEGRCSITEFRARPSAERALQGLRQALGELCRVLGPHEEVSRELGLCLERATGFAETLDAFLKPGETDTEAWVGWAEAGDGQGVLQAQPLAAISGMQRLREQHQGAWVFTSATLAAGGRFDHFLAALGAEDARTLALPSPFDWAQQARLWLPEGLPENPNGPDFRAALARLVVWIAERSQGGVFLLCTSKNAVRTLATELRPRLKQSLFVQDKDVSRQHLVEAFRQDGNGVLIGTSSFWEGVDVPGRALRVVVIDKLPFASPGDPLQKARSQALEQAGRNAFTELSLPEAIVQLRQGVGRLIRNAKDRGLLVLCDPRLRSKAYGRSILEALPPLPRVEGRQAAEGWIRSL